MTIRIYGKTLETWSHEDEKGRKRIYQTEIAFKEIDAETGEIVEIGSEDFSPEREKQDIDYRWIYTWNGEKRNKGGHRWFDCQGSIKFRKSHKKALAEYLKNKYNAELVQLR